MKEVISDYYASIITRRAMVIYWNFIANSIDIRKAIEDGMDKILNMWNSS